MNIPSLRGYLPSSLCNAQILGASRDRADEEHKATMNFTPAQLFALEKETLLTIALATAAGTVLCAECCVLCCCCWVCSGHESTSQQGLL
jgi:hypothetical protein